MLRALDRAVRHSVPKPTALIVNFPSNPTAYLADLDFYREIVAFARRHEIWIMSDLAYAEIYFGDTPPPSLLQVPGAKDIAVEFTSMSKTYSMPGWRMGFAAGNPRLISALARMKSYLDYGAFTPIQVAATAALNGPQDCVAEMRALYRERRDVLIRGLAAAGWDVPSPGRVDVRLGADPAALRAARQRGVQQAAAGAGQGGGGAGHRLRRARRGLSCASRWWRTRTGCARRCRIIRGFLQTGSNQADPALVQSGGMSAPLRSGSPASGTVGAGVLTLLRRERRCGGGAGRAADRGHRRLRARPRARPRRVARRAALVRRSGGAGRPTRTWTWWWS